MTQRALALKAGIKEGRLNLIRVDHEATLAEFLALADAMQMPVEMLMGFSLGQSSSGSISQQGSINQAGTHNRQNIKIGPIYFFLRKGPSNKATMPPRRKRRRSSSTLRHNNRFTRLVERYSVQLDMVGRSGALAVALLMVVVGVLGLIIRWQPVTEHTTLDTASALFYNTIPAFVCILLCAKGYHYCTVQVFA